MAQLHAAGLPKPQYYELRFPNGTMKVYGVLPVTSGSAPQVPTGLAADTITAGFVILVANDLGDATSWTWYRDGVPLGEPSSAPNFVDDTVVPSHADYSYQVQGTNGFGSSLLSDAILVTTPANTAPEWLLGPQIVEVGVGYSLDLNLHCTDIDLHDLSFSIVSGSVAGLTLVGDVYGGVPTTLGSFPVVFRANDGFITVDVGVDFTVLNPDDTAPSTPTNVEATPVGSTVTVTCDPSTDASGILHYRWFRDGSFRATTAPALYEEQSVPDGTYTYSVSAVDASASQNESEQGFADPVIVSVVPPAPDTPINFVANAVSSSQINLSWEPGASGPSPTRYELYRSQSPTGPWTANLLPTDLPLSFNDTGRNAGTTYYYQLWAFNTTVPSDNSATANATTQGTTSNPTPNKIVQANGAGGAITTIQAMLTGLAANDLVEIRSNTPGTLWTNTESLTLSNKNFTQATMPRIWTRDGDRLMLKGSGSTAPILLVRDSSWIEWAGNSSGRDGFEAADPATWNPLTGGKAGPHVATMRGWNSHHIFFRRGKAHGIATGTKGNFFRRDCDKIMFDDFTINMHGNPDHGDLLDIYSSRTILKNVDMQWGGHDQLGCQAPYFVAINVTYNGKWSDANAAYDGLGSRACGMTGCAHDTWSPTKGGNQHVGITTDNEFEFGPQLMHKCHVKNVFPEIVGNLQPATKKQSYKLIERGTIYTDLTDACWWVGPAFGNVTVYEGDGLYPGPGQAECYTYHITGYRTDGIWTNAGNNWKATLHSTSEMQKFRFKNIVAADIHDVPTAGRSIIYWKTPSVPIAGWPNKWKGTEWDGLIVQGDATRKNFELDDVEKAIGATAEAFWPDNISNTQVATTLNFADVGTVENRTRAGLTLISGSGFQTARPLTTTTGAGSNTTILPVVDSGYFADLEDPATWNLADMGLENGWVAIGANTTAAASNLRKIASINHSTNTITLATPATFSNGDGVWFAGNASMGDTIGIWANYGAGQ